MSGRPRIQKIIFILLHLTLWKMSDAMECSRSLSRVVREYIDFHIRPVYKTHNIEISRSCPFHAERDFFHSHETHKTEEGYGKWACEYCGKMFYSESFLDNHLQSRHSDHLYTGPDAVCLADYCDVFRCDIISGRVEPTFWDSALCIEDDLSDLITKCNNVFSQCYPKGASVNTISLIVNKTKGLVCSSLTCNKYWFTGKIESSQWKMLLKTFCTVMLIGGMIVYYFVAYHHFYLESSHEPVHRKPFKPYARDFHSMPQRKLRRKSSKGIT